MMNYLTRKKIQDYTKYIDHTLLTPTATWYDIDKVCIEAIEYKVASLCIPASYVKKVADKYSDLNICTVIGFPNGYQTTKTKVYEAAEAISNGAREIDMVINIGELKSKNYNYVENEINQIKSVIDKSILKVIIEACYLTDDEIIKICSMINRTDADFIKTSTGFGVYGATHENVTLIKKHIDGSKKVKAAGGISDFNDINYYIGAGCDRLGTSKGIKILLEHFEGKNEY